MWENGESGLVGDSPGRLFWRNDEIRAWGFENSCCGLLICFIIFSILYLKNSVFLIFSGTSPFVH